MMKYYRRYKSDGATFYVDEQGVPVAEAQALTNLVEAGAKRTELAEGRHGKSLEQQLQDRDAELARLRGGGKDRLLDACKGLSDSEEEAALLAKLLREA